MISHQVAYYDLAFLLSSQLMENLTKMLAYAAENHFLSLFRDKNNMIPAIPCCMSKTLVLSHWEHPISWRRLEVPFDRSTRSNLG